MDDRFESVSGEGMEESEISMVENLGFKSTGRGDEVICACCSVRFKHWKTASNLICRHEVVKESCSFRERELTTQGDDFLPEPLSGGVGHV